MSGKIHDKEYNLDDIPLDDTKTYALYQRGDTVGTFQFESDGMRKYLKELKPTVHGRPYSHECAVSTRSYAVYTPNTLSVNMAGARLNTRMKTCESFWSRLTVSWFTGTDYAGSQGLWAGYSLGEADILRRAMGKKKVEEMEKQKAIFMDRAVNEKGYDKKNCRGCLRKNGIFCRLWVQ